MTLGYIPRCLQRKKLLSECKEEIVGRRILDRGILCCNSRGTWEWKN